MNIQKPPKDLYIYHINGVVPETDELVFGDHFLGNWLEDTYSFLFFRESSDDVVDEYLRRNPTLKLLDVYYFEYEQWQGGGLDPLRVEDFLIVPPWGQDKKTGKEIELKIDPGVVFGTGLHPTTRDCLRAINYISRSCPLGVVMDIGTGTGILAIAAASLGADYVLALDLNPLSIKTAENNVRLNQLEKTIKTIRGKAEDYASEQADVVIANIHYDVIRVLIEKEEFTLREWIIFSGLLRSQVRDIKDRVYKKGFAIIKEWDHEMTWHTFIARKI